ncbi:sulfatase [Paludibaculum fermentans]|uniref:Sulfatase n=2 Tax=Paludibaculum fermentans TaxID=1473598 RepID=A0A7S7NYM9_PALFE|nr:sulfatase [Paludibaculum fermentans]
MERRQFLRQLAGAAAVLPTAAFQARKKPLNFVFILADDLGWTDLSSFGSQFYETPNIDRLAQQGTRFTNAYAACPVCSPTRASIMTGKYPARLGITNYLPGKHPTPYSKLIGVDCVQQLPLEEKTIAEVLKPAGYRTGQFGKWHLGGEGFGPDRQGFDTTFAAQGGVGSYFYPGWRGKSPVIEGKQGEYITDRLGDEAAAFIQANRANPFFVYLPHFAPHVPLESKKEYIRKYSAKIRSGARHYDPVYAGMIQSLDDSVGRVVKAVEENGLADNTIVVFNSDNGGLSAPEWLLKPTTSNWPLREGKGHVYEGGIRVPLIIRGPGVRKGAVDDTPISSVDYLPTFAELAGVPAPEGVDGRSFAALLPAARRLPPRPLYWHYPHYSNQLGRPASAVRLGEYKLIRFHEDNHVELYRVTADIGEQADLAETQKAKVQELTRLLDAWLKEVDAKFPTPNPNYDPVREAEGYWWKQPGAYERFGK